MKKTTLFNFVFETGGRGLDSFPEDVRKFESLVVSHVWDMGEGGVLHPTSLPFWQRKTDARSIDVDLNYQGGRTREAIRQAMNSWDREIDIPVEIGGEYYNLKVVRRKKFFFREKFSFRIPYVSRGITFSPNKSLGQST